MEEPVKILFVSSTFNVSTHGPSNFIKGLYKYSQTDHNMNLTIITEDSPNNVTKDIIPVKIKLPRLLKGLQEIYRGYKYSQIAKKELKSRKYDIVIFNNYIHGWFFSIFSSKASLFFINDISNLIYKTEYSIFQRKYYLYKIYSLIGSKICRKHSVCFNSNYLKSKYHSVYDYICNSYVLYKFAYPIEKEEHLSERKTEITKIAFIKNEWKNGGLKILIHALSKLNNYIFELSIIGPPQSDKNYILSLLDDFSHIHPIFYGPTEHNKTLHILSIQDLLCVPSLNEGLGVANIEALSLNIPVVSTNVGGIKEVLDYGKAGWLAKRGDVVSLKNEIKNCLENDRERRNRVLHGYNRFTKLFTIEKAYYNFLKICKDTIEYASHTR